MNFIIHNFLTRNHSKWLIILLFISPLWGISQTTQFDIQGLWKSYDAIQDTAETKDLEGSNWMGFDKLNMTVFTYLGEGTWNNKDVIFKYSFKNNVLTMSKKGHSEKLKVVIYNNNFFSYTYSGEIKEGPATVYLKRETRKKIEGKKFK